MPLFFGSSTVKPQHLSSRNGSGTLDLKDSRGTVVKLQNHTVVIEKKLAEGGFAIIYLVNDKNNRQFALKRQFINDDRHLEACKRECCIVKCLQGHQNIVRYVDHLISRNKTGIYEYSLLTLYYKSSVLQLMNERLMSRRSLSPVEVLSIFCDMCEAVARLHHSQTPVIHRDLKVENILIDDRGRPSPPRYVLCDFGSATTKVFSLDTHSRQFIEDEILRYTTLSYRAPEMIDIYAGRPIGTKCDIWAMGVLLYKLCYFTLPFGESSLAIQNCSYIFPNEPDCPDELKAIIKVLLQPDIDLRPDIYQVCCLAFEAAGKKCPVGNLNKVRRILLSEALDMLRKNASTYQSSQPEMLKSDPKTTANERFCIGGVSTSVNPRLRPKPSSATLRNAKTLNIAEIGISSQSTSTPEVITEQPPQIVRQNSVSSPDISSTRNADPVLHSLSITDPFVLGFKDLEEEVCMDNKATANVDSQNLLKGSVVSEQPHHMQPKDRDALSMHLSAPQLYPDSNRSNTFPVTSSKPGGYLRSSAFKPYSETSGKLRSSSKEIEERATNSSAENFCQLDNDSFELVASTSKWNPFIGAPFSDTFNNINGRFLDDETNESDKALFSLIESDPFGAAPFEEIPEQVTSANQRSVKRTQTTYSGGDKGIICADQTDVFIDLKDVVLQKSNTNNYKHLNINDCSTHLGCRESNVQLYNEVKSRPKNDWSSESSSSESSVTDDLGKSSILNAGGHVCRTKITASNSNVYPVIPESSSAAPLLSSSSFSLKSNTTPATSSSDAYNPYTAHLCAHSTLGESIVLHETNPFVNMDTTAQTADTNSFAAKMENFSFCPDTASSHTFLHNSAFSFLQSDCAKQDCNIPSDVQTAAEQTLQKEQKDQETALKKLSSHSSPSSLRCRLLSAGSSHSSDDSPQIDESGDKMLLKGARNRSSHGISGKKKKISYMEYADRAFRKEVSPYKDVVSAKRSPTLKKHSKKHSGQSGFKRNGPGKLDASSFVNTSFQAEDWESRPLSPKRQVLPQIS